MILPDSKDTIELNVDINKLKINNIVNGKIPELSKPNFQKMLIDNVNEHG